MYVPSYVPEPIEISGNVAEQKWSVVVGFVRRVSVIHFVTLLLIIGLAMLPIASAPLGASLPMLATTLVGLSITRNVGKGKRWEQVLSALLAPTLFLSLAQVISHYSQRGWPTWSLALGPAIAVAYVLIAGRDLSFLGMFVFSAIFSSLATGYAVSGLGGKFVVETLAINLGFLFFYVYDLAALLTRRRLGEEWGAVLDLYRDVLNCITYPIRVWRHWKKHQIWAIPKL